jgi:hypothetical protein
MGLHSLEEVKTKEEFVKYFNHYGTHVIVCIFDHYGIRRVNNYTYEIIYHREKHRPNWYNNTEVKERGRIVGATDCFDFIRLEARRQKLKKLRTSI